MCILRQRYASATTTKHISTTQQQQQRVQQQQPKGKRKDQRSMLRVQLRRDSKECTVAAQQRGIHIDGRRDGRSNQQHSGSSCSSIRQFLLHFVASSAWVDSRHVRGARLPCRTSLRRMFDTRNPLSNCGEDRSVKMTSSTKNWPPWTLCCSAART